MRRFLYWLTFGILAVVVLGRPLYAQNTIPVTGHVSDSSTGVPAGMSVKFELSYCGGNYPRVVGAFGIVRQNFTLTPNLAGLITGTIVPNDLINCGGVTGGTCYNITLLLNGIPQIPTACYAVLSTMGTFNLDTATPIASSTGPPVPGGPYDATYDNLTLLGLLSGGSALFSGTVQANAFELAAAPTPCNSGAYMTGLTTFLIPICNTPAAATITSFNTRGGAVLPVTGDYSCAMVTGAICSLPTNYYQLVGANGTSQTARNRLNLISGGATTVTCADDSGTNSSDCTITSPAVPTATDFYWTFTTCNNMTGQPSQCTGTTTLPGTMPNASYQIFCQTNSGGTEPSDQVIVFHVATPLPTTSGASLAYAMIQIFQNGTAGGVPVTAMCHAHHA
jgi:hypothetical protein